jgi:hypothetical protein
MELEGSLMCSNFGRDTGYPDWYFPRFFLSHFKQIPGYYLGEAMTASFQILSNSPFINHPTIRNYIMQIINYKAIITLFRTLRHLSLSWAKLTLSTSFYTVSLRSVLILSSYISLSSLFPFLFSGKNSVRNAHNSHACCMSCSSDSPWVDQLNNNKQRTPMRLLNVQFAIFSNPMSSLLRPNTCILLSALFSNPINLWVHKWNIKYRPQTKTANIRIRFCHMGRPFFGYRTKQAVSNILYIYVCSEFMHEIQTINQDSGILVLL